MTATPTYTKTHTHARTLKYITASNYNCVCSKNSHEYLVSYWPPQYRFFRYVVTPNFCSWGYIIYS